jgi:hypothetical protein
VANRVHAVVEAVKATGLRAAVDPGVRQPASAELRAGEDTVITLSERRDPYLRRLVERSLSHSESKSSRGAKLAP